MATQNPVGYRTSAVTTRKPDSSVAVVTVDGELDFTNVDELIGVVTHLADERCRVVLDLSGVEFFGSAGFAALSTLNDTCASRDVPWAVVPSKSVDRVVRICDTECVLPLRETVDAALEPA